MYLVEKIRICKIKIKKPYLRIALDQAHKKKNSIHKNN
jgi:hypothetical protein